MIFTRLIQILIVGFMTWLLVACNTDQSAEIDTATLVLHRKQDSQALSDVIPPEINRLSIEVYQIIDDDDSTKDIFITQGDAMSTDTLKLPVPAGLPLRVISEAYADSEAGEEFLYGGELIIKPLAKVESRPLQLQLDEKVTISLGRLPGPREVLPNDPNGFPIVAKTTGLNNTQLNWYVNGIKDGNETVGTITTAADTIINGGLYQAPTNQPKDMTVTIRVTPEVAPSYEQTYGFDVDRRPTADPGPPQLIEVGALVTLDGRGSTDFDDDTFDYIWTPPEDIELSATDIAQPTFTIPEGAAAGTKYTFLLEVKDEVTDDDNRGSSDPLPVDITVKNSPPTLLPPKPPREVIVGEEITLPDVIIDLNNDTLDYEWTAPEGITLSGSSEQNPSFTVPPGMSGTLPFTLVVDDRNGGSSETTVEVTILNSPPTANAGPDQKAELGTQVTLDGSGSTDPNNDKLSYQWTAPEGITLSNPRAPNPSFTVPSGSSGTLPFTLVVDDSNGGSSEATVEVEVEDGPNSPPTANAGQDQDAVLGTQVTLDGSGSADPDGDKLTYQWNGPFFIPGKEQPTFTLPTGTQPGPLEITLVVTDSKGSTSESDPNPDPATDYKVIITVLDVPLNDFDEALSKVEDDFLRQCIKETGKTQISELTQLRCTDINIKQLDGLESFTLLTDLFLDFNQIQNVAALSNLTALTVLGLSFNKISDIEPLSHLTALTQLQLLKNDITDISKLSQLTNLNELYLGRNTIDNISKLSDLTALTILSLYTNKIQDISELSGLTALIQLGLQDNEIQDISILSDLTNLIFLHLSDNQIDDILAVSNLTALTTLDLDSNEIDDITPLSNLTALTQLNLQSNPLQDISILSDLTALTRLDLRDTQITDVYSVLSDLTNLEELNLGDKNLSCLDVEALDTQFDLGDGKNIGIIKWSTCVDP